MKISICTGPILPVPAIDGGAVHRFWSEMAPCFAAAGHEVHVFARAHPAQAPEELTQGVCFHRRGGYPHSRSLIWNLARSWLDARQLAKRLPNADVLISNDIALPRALSGRPETGRLIIALGRQPKGQLRFYPRVSGIAAASRSVADAVSAQCSRLSPCTRVLPYAINLESFSRTGVEQRDMKSLLYAGRIHAEKGLDLLIQAFRSLHERDPEVRLTCIGPWAESQGGGGEGYRRGLQLASSDLPVQWLAPEFNARSLASIFRRHSVFVYPSLAEQGETFGVAPLEAMACGLVPVVSSLPCFTDFLQSGVHGETFIHLGPERIEALASAILRAMAYTPGMRDEVHAQALRFSVESVSERWLEAISDWAAVP